MLHARATDDASPFWGAPVRFLDGLDTEVADDDEVTILPAVTGV